MQGQQCQKSSEKFKEHNHLDRILSHEFDAHAVLGNRTDFLNERNALQEAVESFENLRNLHSGDGGPLGIESAFGKRKF
jgi:hypothetical protein